MRSLPTVTPVVARRLAVRRQRLEGPRPSADPAGILGLVRDLGCVQLDPISVVAPSHRLVLRSRLGAYDAAHLDALRWRDRSLFEYWAHVASIVMTEDYPIHSALMRTYVEGEARTAYGRKYREWLAANDTLRRRMLAEIRRRGPLPARHFEDTSTTDWYSAGWTSGRNVSQMLHYLWTKGKILVAGRTGQHRLWDVAERCLPDWTPREKLPEREVVRRAAQRSLRALGVATPRQIEQHFIRGRYPGLAGVLDELEAEGRVSRVRVDAGGKARWYVHADDLPEVERLASGDWEPRTTLLSPFDNLICDRARTEALFGFTFRIEIYVPKALRKYGYYVLPILHGDRLIGRVDPTMDRKRGRLTVNAVYAEPDAPKGREAARAVAAAIEELGAFLGATSIDYAGEVPASWKRALRA